ncbi:MAG TPA: hypothetical protein VF008_15010 [Niastella sp.]
MSYEYFLQAHLDQKSQEISTEKILLIFKDHIKEKDESYIDLQFEEGNACTIFIDTKEPTVSHLMVSRPCDSMQLSECLYQVMLLGNFVFFEPDGKHLIILNPDTEKHLPADMIETLGKPAIAENKNAFLELYFNNR